MARKATTTRPVADDLKNVLTGFYRDGRLAYRVAVDTLSPQEWQEVARTLLFNTGRERAEGLLRCVDHATVLAVADGQVDVPAMIARIKLEQG